MVTAARTAGRRLRGRAAAPDLPVLRAVGRRCRWAPATTPPSCAPARPRWPPPTRWSAGATGSTSGRAPADVATKLLTQNLADVAAMGATSTAILVSLVADPATSLDWAVEFARALGERRAGDLGVVVAGGDLSSAPGGRPDGVGHRPGRPRRPRTGAAQRRPPGSHRRGQRHPRPLGRRPGPARRVAPTRGRPRAAYALRAWPTTCAPTHRCWPGRHAAARRRERDDRPVRRPAARRPPHRRGQRRAPRPVPDGAARRPRGPREPWSATRRGSASSPAARSTACWRPSRRPSRTAGAPSASWRRGRASPSTAAVQTARAGWDPLPGVAGNRHFRA